MSRIPGLVSLYAKLSRMRILSSSKVREAAGAIERKMLDA
jgi:hypothetical protein